MRSVNVNDPDLENVDAGTNRSDRLERVLPGLSCSHCPPNRGENAKRNQQPKEKLPREKAMTKGRNQARAHKNQGR